MSKSLSVGDVVALRSEAIVGITMTISKIYNENYVQCIWFNSITHEYDKDDFPIAALVLLNEVKSK